MEQRCMIFWDPMLWMLLMHCFRLFLDIIDTFRPVWRSFFLDRSLRAPSLRLSIWMIFIFIARWSFISTTIFYITEAWYLWELLLLWVFITRIVFIHNEIVDVIVINLRAIIYCRIWNVATHIVYYICYNFAVSWCILLGIIVVLVSLTATSFFLRVLPVVLKNDFSSLNPWIFVWIIGIIRLRNIIWGVILTRPLRGGRLVEIKCCWLRGCWGLLLSSSLGGIYRRFWSIVLSCFILLSSLNLYKWLVHKLPSCYFWVKKILSLYGLI